MYRIDIYRLFFSVETQKKKKKEIALQVIISDSDHILWCA